jgi:hypothetical protein
MNDLERSIHLLEKEHQDLEELARIKKSRWSFARYKVKEMLGYRKLKIFDVITLMNDQQRNVQTLNELLVNNVNQSRREGRIELLHHQNLGSIEADLEAYQEARLVLENMDRAEDGYQEQLQRTMKLRREFRRERSQLRRNRINEPVLEFMEMQEDFYEAIFFGSEEMLLIGMMYEKILKAIHEMYSQFGEINVLQRGMKGMSEYLAKLKDKHLALRKETAEIVAGTNSWEQQELELYQDILGGA